MHLGGPAKPDGPHERDNQGKKSLLQPLGEEWVDLEQGALFDRLEGTHLTRELGAQKKKKGRSRWTLAKGKYTWDRAALATATAIQPNLEDLQVTAPGQM